MFLESGAGTGPSQDQGSGLGFGTCAGFPTPGQLQRVPSSAQQSLWKFGNSSKSKPPLVQRGTVNAAGGWGSLGGTQAGLVVLWLHFWAWKHHKSIVARTASGSSIAPTPCPRGVPRRWQLLAARGLPKSINTRRGAL